MVDRDVVMAKIGIIKRCLLRIKEVTGLKPDSLEDITKQDVFVLNLQRAAQAAIDLAAHVVASEGYGVPQDLKETFTLLSGAHVIDGQTSQKMQKMVGFRNVAVHEYQDLNPAILKSVLTGGLGDFEDYYSQVVEHFGLSNQRRSG